MSNTSMSNTSPHPFALGAVVLSGLSFQLGAALGALIMPTIGFVGVVAVRMLVATPVLLLVGRPKMRDFSRDQLIQVVCLGLVMATMSLSLFAAVERIGLGLSVTIEFMGPLAVSLMTSKRILDVVCVLAAAGAVVVLTGAGGHVDTVGILLAFLAAGCWASVILLNSALGATLPGTEGAAAAMAIAALVVVPAGISTAGASLLDPEILWIGIGAAILASVFPPLLELFAIRRLRRATYGTLMALYPAIAAVCGFGILHEEITAVQWLAILTICVVSAVVTWSGARAAGRTTRVRNLRFRERRSASDEQCAHAPETGGQCNAKHSDPVVVPVPRVTASSPHEPFDLTTGPASHGNSFASQVFPILDGRDRWPSQCPPSDWRETMSTSIPARIPTLRSIDHVAFTVPVLDEAVAFFVDHFGGELVFEDGPFSDEESDGMFRRLHVAPRAVCRLAMIRMGDHMNIELFEYKAPEQIVTPPRNSDIGGHHLAFYVDDIDAGFEYLKSIPGVQVMVGPNGVDDQAPVAGQRWFYFRTPWGLQMELTTCSTEGFYEGLPGSRMAPPAARWR